MITSPEISAKRIQKRMEIQTGRKCENVIDHQYLADLNQEENFMINALEQQGVKIIRLEWNDEKTEDEIKESIRSLCEEINKHKPVDMLLDLHRRTVA